MFIKVKVKTGARKESFVQKKDDHFDISVSEKAERNMANKRVRELIARHYSIPLGRVRIVTGHTKPSKILSVGLET